MNVDPVSIRAIKGEARERQMLKDLVRNLEDRGIRFFWFLRHRPGLG